MQCTPLYACSKNVLNFNHNFNPGIVIVSLKSSLVLCYNHTSESILRSHPHFYSQFYWCEKVLFSQFTKLISIISFLEPALLLR